MSKMDEVLALRRQLQAVDRRLREENDILRTDQQAMRQLRHDTLEREQLLRYLAVRKDTLISKIKNYTINESSKYCI